MNILDQKQFNISLLVLFLACTANNFGAQAARRVAQTTARAAEFMQKTRAIKRSLFEQKGIFKNHALWQKMDTKQLARFKTDAVIAKGGVSVSGVSSGDVEYLVRRVTKRAHEIKKMHAAILALEQSVAGCKSSVRKTKLPDLCHLMYPTI